LNFVGFIQDNIHVLIEAEDFALQSDVYIVIEPNLNSGFALQEAKDDSQGVDAFRLAFFGHL